MEALLLYYVLSFTHSTSTFPTLANYPHWQKAYGFLPSSFITLK